MPQCPFCHKNHSTKRGRGEHVLPKWMSRQFPDTVWAIENTLTKYVRKSEKFINITTPMPCSDCNSGWMSTLENHSKPVLVPLMNGEPAILSARDQLLIAIWLFKTATMYDLHAEKQAPRPHYFEDQEYSLLMSSLAFHPFYQFYTGIYKGSQPGLIREDHLGVSIVQADSLQPLNDPVRAYTFTLAIKHLVLQIFCAKIIDDLPFRMRPFRGFAIQLGASRNSVHWPPERQFGDTLIENFAKRWTEGLPPPVS